MTLREPGPMPPAFNFTRFLVSSIAFVTVLLQFRNNLSVLASTALHIEAEVVGLVYEVGSEANSLNVAIVLTIFAANVAILLVEIDEKMKGEVENYDVRSRRILRADCAMS